MIYVEKYGSPGSKFDNLILLELVKDFLFVDINLDFEGYEFNNIIEMNNIFGFNLCNLITCPTQYFIIMNIEFSPIL